MDGAGRVESSGEGPRTQPGGQGAPRAKWRGDGGALVGSYSCKPQELSESLS